MVTRHGEVITILDTESTANEGGRASVTDQAFDEILPEIEVQALCGDPYEP